MSVRLTLVSGSSGEARERAIAAQLDPAIPTVVILEGFPSGNPVLAKGSAASQHTILRIAAGCMCCTGNLVLRVTLNRILRNPPQQVFLGVADSSHLEALRRFLASAPYDRLLALAEDCRA